MAHVCSFFALSDNESNLSTEQLMMNGDITALFFVYSRNSKVETIRPRLM